MTVEAPPAVSPLVSPEILPPALPIPSPKPSQAGRVRAGLFLGSLAAALLLSVLQALAQTFFIPEIIAALPYISLPILSFAMLFYPGHRYLGLIGLVTSFALFYFLVENLTSLRTC